MGKEYCPEHKFCMEKIDILEDRLNAKSALLDQHGIEVAVLKSNMLNLTKSLNGLTKALWGVAVTIFATLLSFFVWYVQNKPN